MKGERCRKGIREFGMIRKFVEKYTNMAEEMKAAVWYTVGNVVQKIAPWLVIVILTHFLAVESYGVYTVFMSWLEIVEIIVTMRIFVGGYVAGLVQNDEDKHTYTATMQVLLFLLISVWFGIYFLVRKPLNAFSEMDVSLWILMLVSMYGTASFGLWASKQRVNNRYKPVLAATVLYGLMGPVLGALTVVFRCPNPIFTMILVRTVIQSLVAVYFTLDNLKGAKRKFDIKYALGALKYNIPLVPYYLAMVLLNHSDRLMIQKYCGFEDAGLYGVAYSIAALVFIVSGALNLSLQAWIFKSIKAGNREKQARYVTIGTVVVALLCLAELLLAPEAIIIISGKVYLEAVWVMAPIIVSLLVMFIYHQYVNILLYYEKTGLIMVASVVTAAVNIGLNAWLIPVFGYTAAGYTTLFSYMLLMIFYMILMWVTCRKKKLDAGIYFNVRLQMLILLAMLVLGGVSMLLYELWLLRYILVAVIVLVMVLFRKNIMTLLEIKK